jgi:hypothetical protein
MYYMAGGFLKITIINIMILEQNLASFNFLSFPLEKSGQLQSFREMCEKIKAIIIFYR